MKEEEEEWKKQLKEAKDLFDEGLIEKAEYDQMREESLALRKVPKESPPVTAIVKDKVHRFWRRKRENKWDLEEMTPLERYAWGIYEAERRKAERIREREYWDKRRKRIKEKGRLIAYLEEVLEGIREVPLFVFVGILGYFLVAYLFIE